MAYRRQAVTLKELFASGQTDEPSLGSLRERAQGGILVCVGNRARAFLFDKDLSIVRVRAARALLRPGRSWKQIETIFQELDKTGLLDQRIIERLDEGRSYEEVAQEIRAWLEQELPWQ